MSASAPAPRSTEGREPEFPVATTRYALGLLVVVYVVNFLDRQVLSILLESIKQDLQVSDTALGFLSGIAFALLYTTVGIPVARWADVGVRRNIIALALFVWSLMTALQGMARSFLWLALARVGVGIGEAGCSPPAHAMISDFFPPERRATALAIYSVGIPIGSAIGLLAGGWLDQFFGWRVAFLVVGLPGLLLALVVRKTLPEPTRGYWEPAGAAEPQRAGFTETRRFLGAMPTFLHLAFGASLHAFYGYGAAAFNPAFFRRVHEVPQGELGTWLAAIAATAGVLGTYLGGYLSDRLGTRDKRWYLWLPAIATVFSIPFIALMYLWPDARGALVLAGVPALFGGMYLGPTFALTQGLVRPEMRAMAAAILLFVINLIGLGLGPQGVGLLSDLLKPQYGDDSIRWALLWIVSLGAAWSVVHYLLAARTVRDDLARGGG